jgi:RNA polymerase sigma-70 factor (ECF subfamily)
VDQRENDWTALMRLALAGDAAAYDRCLRGMAGALRATVRRGLVRAGRSPAETEDVVQEILLAVHLKRHTWDATRPIGPWLYAIARYKLIDALRRRGGRADIPIDDVAETIAAEESEGSVLERDVERSLDRLSAGQAAVVRAIAVDGASISEAAAKLGMSEGAVRVALHRGLAALAQKSGAST